MKYCPHCRKPVRMSVGPCPHCAEDLETEPYEALASSAYTGLDAEEGDIELAFEPGAPSGSFGFDADLKTDRFVALHGGTVDEKASRLRPKSPERARRERHREIERRRAQRGPARTASPPIKPGRSPSRPAPPMRDAAPRSRSEARAPEPSSPRTAHRRRGVALARVELERAAVPASSAVPERAAAEPVTEPATADEPAEVTIGTAETQLDLGSRPTESPSVAPGGAPHRPVVRFGVRVPEDARPTEPPASPSTDDPEVEVLDEADDGFGGLIPIFDDDRDSALPRRGVTRAQLADVAAALGEAGERVVVGILEEAPDAIAALKAASSSSGIPDQSATTLADELSQILAKHEAEAEAAKRPSSSPDARPVGAHEPAGETAPEPAPAPATDADSAVTDTVQKAVSILANLARQMRSKAQHEGDDGEEIAEAVSDEMTPLVSREEADLESEARRERHKRTARRIGLLDAAMLGDKLKHEKVRAVYDAGRRAGLVDAARELDALFAFDDLRLDDLYDLEERLYELAIGSMDIDEDDEDGDDGDD